MTDQETAQPNLNTPEGRGEQMAKFVMNTPDKVPAKFRREDGSIDGDALAASYVELERRQSGAPAAAPAADAVNVASIAADTAEKPAAPASADDILGSLDAALGTAEPKAPAIADVWKAAQKEIADGALSDDTKGKLLAGGVPEELIQSAVSSAKHRQEAFKAKAVEIAGSPQALQATIDWAKNNLPTEQRQAMVAALQGPNAELLMSGLVQRARAAGALGEQGNLVSTGGAPPVSDNARIRPFTDSGEMQAAMADPRYATDPAYRLAQMKRLAVTRGQDPSAYDKGLVS